jgi:hypothetical protein
MPWQPMALGSRSMARSWLNIPAMAEGLSKLGATDLALSSNSLQIEDAACL